MEEPPAFLKQGNKNMKPGSSNWAGIKFENKFADHMAAIYGDRAIHGPWIEYFDERGRGYCQPDVVLLASGDEPLIVFECKLTFRARKAGAKMINMYGPVAEYIWGSRPLLVQVCRFLRPSAKHTLIVKDIDDIWACGVKSNDDVGIITWNWKPF
jgi:hypothetical protein